jgi:hypothetical protein
MHSKIFRTVVIALVGAVIVAGMIGGICWYQKNQLKNDDNGTNIQQPQGGTIGEYEWKNETLQVQYGKVSWNKIVVHKLAGFSLVTPLVEKRTEGCNAIPYDAYLHVEGGLCGVGYWLEDLKGTKIDSKEKLLALLGSIDNEAEAMSFVVETQRGLIVGAQEVPEGHTAVVRDGFLVQAVYSNMYGCRDHRPIGVIFKVSKSGEIEQVASEKMKPLGPDEPIICVD